MPTDPSPMFTVVIPSYNRGYILWRAINSVLAQTDRRFEIVVVDDGSTDCTARMLEAFRDEPLRTITLADGPHGLSHARNVALDSSSAPLVAYLDSDDVWPVGYLAAMAEAARALPDCGLFYTEQERVVWDRSATGRWTRLAERRSAYGDLSLAAVRDLRWPGITGVVHRRSPIRFDESLTWLEDWDFFFRSLLHWSDRCSRVDGVVVAYDQVHGEGSDSLCGAARREPEREAAFRRRLLDKWGDELSASARARLSLAPAEIAALGP